jgi:formate dehydrogenase major subunit
LFDYVPPVEYPAEFDLTLNNGRLLEQFHEGNLTGKSEGINKKLPQVFVEVSPELAKERGVENGSLVRLVSPYGSIKLAALITDRVRGMEVYVPMHSASHENAVNLLTGNGFDVVTNTPAYKQTKVRMEVISVKGAIPLPKTNPRYKKRHPQNGVEANRKWNRPGYVSLVD